METTYTQLQKDMASELTNRYELISKLDALKFLKSMFPASSIQDKLKAYELAYSN